MNPSDKPGSSDQRQQGHRPQNAGGDNDESPERRTENVSPTRVQTGGGETRARGSSGGGNVRPQGPEGGASGGGAGGDGQGSGEGSRRKRGRGDEPGGSGSGQKPGRKKGELDAPANVEPSCSLCGKKFGSWKAVFGHLRAHPREWRGAYPPPTFNAEGSPVRQPVLEEQLAPALFNLASETLAKIGEETAASVPQGSRPSSSVAGAGAGAGASSSSSRRGGLSLDLNAPQEEAGPSSPKSGGFDLNMPPSEKDDDNGSA